MQTLEQAYQAFDLNQLIEQQLIGHPQSINAYEECCGRYVGQNKIALIWEGLEGETKQFTFDELATYSGQLANYFKSQGVQPGQCIAGLLPRTPELLITILATWRMGAIYQPLFTAFESKAIEHRLSVAQTQLVVTNKEQAAKLNAVNNLKVLTVEKDSFDILGQPDFWNALKHFDAQYQSEMITFNDHFLMMFTSGTTGLAKPVPVPLKAILSFKGYMTHAVGLNQSDSFWNLADPGWAYGLYYGITGPLSLGHSIILDEQGFSVDRAIELIKKYKVSNLIGSPTAFRMFFGFKEKFDTEIKDYLRVVSSAGEPLTPEVVHWFKNDLDINIYDQYGQTELGMVIANHHALEHHVKIGSAGYAIPGYRFVVLDEHHQELSSDSIGVLAIDSAASPLFWFTGYGENNRSAFVGQYYITGDTVKMNAFGSIDFVGRIDDVITTSGYRVGPFDVESTLLECQEVLESAVIGKPDAIRTEIVKAFVVLKSQYKSQADQSLSEKLKQYVRGRLSKHAYPKEIEFVDQLPKTASGKIQRGVLKQQEISRMQLSG